MKGRLLCLFCFCMISENLCNNISYQALEKRKTMREGNIHQLDAYYFVCLCGAPDQCLELLNRLILKKCETTALFIKTNKKSNCHKIVGVWNIFFIFIFCVLYN